MKINEEKEKLYNQITETVSKFLTERVGQKELPDDIMIKHEKQISELLQGLLKVHRVDFEDFRVYFQKVAWPNVSFKIEPEPFNPSKREWLWTIKKLRERKDKLSHKDAEVLMNAV